MSGVVAAAVVAHVPTLGRDEITPDFQKTLVAGEREMGAALRRTLKQLLRGGLALQAVQGLALQQVVGVALACQGPFARCPANLAQGFAVLRRWRVQQSLWVPAGHFHMQVDAVQQWP